MHLVAPHLYIPQSSRDLLFPLFIAQRSYPAYPYHGPVTHRENINEGGRPRPPERTKYTTPRDPLARTYSLAPPRLCWWRRSMPEAAKYKRRGGKGQAD